MTNPPDMKYLTTALNPDLLAKPYKVQTNWYVIMGAPSCGKTTLINLLSEKGYRTVPETARQLIEDQIDQGNTVEEILADPQNLQRAIEAKQLQIEQNMDAERVFFLDSAVPGSLAWFRVFGIDPNEILLDCFQHRYASVFILERLPYYLDGLRIQDDVLPSFIDEWHSRDFHSLGYQVVRVPVLPPEERLDFALENIPR
jgi:predicted ATPase